MTERTKNKLLWWLVMAGLTALVALGAIANVNVYGQQPTLTPIPQQLWRIEYPTPVRDGLIGPDREYPTPLRAVFFGSHVTAPAAAQSPVRYVAEQQASDASDATGGLKRVKLTPISSPPANVSGFLARIYSHLPPSEWHSACYINGRQIPTSQLDRSTQGHELTHAINARLRNSAGPGCNAAYMVEEDAAVILPEPPTTIRSVARYVQYRGMRFQLYFGEQAKSWNDRPLYIMDECAAYINGALVAVECGDGDAQHEISASREFLWYTQALVRAVEAECPNYDATALKRLHNVNIQRVERLTGPAAAQQQCDLWGGNCNQGVVYRPVQNAQPQTVRCEIDYQKIYREMIAMMAADERFRGKDGQPGPAGSAGKDGVEGKQGDAGPAGPPPTSEQIQAAVAAWIQSHPTEVAALIQPHLDPIYFRTINEATGEKLSPDQPVRLGEGFEFRLTPGVVK